MDASEFDRRLRALVALQRVKCLWFLREDLALTAHAEQLLVLDAIQKHGSLAAFREAGELKQWLQLQPTR